MVEESVNVEEISTSGFLHKRCASPLLLWRKRYYIIGTDDPTPLKNLHHYHQKHQTKKSAKLPIPTSGEASVYEEANRKTFVNIAHATQTGHGLLFYYQSNNLYHIRKPLGIVNLKDVESVTPLHKAGKRHAFCIKTNTREISLAAESENEKWSWIKIIQTKVDEAKNMEPIEYTDAFIEVYHKLANRIAWDTEIWEEPSQPLTNINESTATETNRRWSGIY